MFGEAVRELLKKTPGVLLAGDGLEDLASDIEALQIKHVLLPALNDVPGNIVEKIQAANSSHVEEAVDDLALTVFGVTVHNLLVTGDYPHKHHGVLPRRAKIVKALLRTLLVEATKPLGKQ